MWAIVYSALQSTMRRQAGKWRYLVAKGSDKSAHPSEARMWSQHQGAISQLPECHTGSPLAACLVLNPPEVSSELQLLLNWHAYIFSEMLHCHAGMMDRCLSSRQKCWHEIGSWAHMRSVPCAQDISAETVWPCLQTGQQSLHVLLMYAWTSKSV